MSFNNLCSHALDVLEFIKQAMVSQSIGFSVNIDMECVLIMILEWIIPKKEPETLLDDGCAGVPKIQKFYSILVSCVTNSWYHYYNT
jgi:hypothetical protein